ncbi:ABC transporter ATP-binding protein [Seohaeicola zhoushanensis]|uniref:ABC transporter ATP-binding protein n=1 Tax=Seohaeicola zhoushanensis TaxID=1569283 RepID=A0A8J3H109_9RHOB|nr:ABC transporter ATP-binding protein [Seohaeicola zhoushanensis]GHF62388.1 ABC transporter ATP-binding protein [Seohaeicola zhoushanensis]
MLEVSGLSVSYSGIRALKDVSLTVGKGEIFALIGPNGAGKSTLLNTLSGMVQAQTGHARFDGVELIGRPAHRIARAGLIQVPEGRQVIAPLTVRENLELGRIAAGTRSGDRNALDRVHDLFPVLAERRTQLAGSLSGGQQQMLAIGRALMGAPRILLLDEPSLGLAPVIVREVFDALLRLNASGLTILLVEQNAKLALETAHHAAILEMGRVVMRGTAADLAHDPLVVDHYLGRTEETA